MDGTNVEKKGTYMFCHFITFLYSIRTTVVLERDKLHIKFSFISPVEIIFSLKLTIGI